MVPQTSFIAWRSKVLLQRYFVIIILIFFQLKQLQLGQWKEIMALFFPSIKLFWMENRPL